ncbi:MAG: enoyl-CoA hydratase/isomerase family protein [Deltaproteobacteria bacterium]|nr:enoyl-CoA hydratase/isomerase family protein [Deltaproteobacteria bacterium]
MNNYKFYLLEKKAPLAWIWLNRPEKKNSLNIPAWEELEPIFKEIDNDDDIKVVLIAGKGDSFSTGVDLEMVKNLPELKQAASGSRLKLFERICGFQNAITSIEKSKKPVIAVIHGYCIGAGLDMATACDFRLCSKDAFFSIKETAIGFVPDIGVLQRIRHITGAGIARELAFTSKIFDAAYAKEIFLVNRVYDNFNLLIEGAKKTAEEIAANPPLAVRATKDVMNYSNGKSIEDGLKYVASICSNLIPSEDLYEAISAFVEKRKPEFKGS